MFNMPPTNFSLLIADYIIRQNIINWNQDELWNIIIT